MRTRIIGSITWRAGKESQKVDPQYTDTANKIEYVVEGVPQLQWMGEMKW